MARKTGSHAEITGPAIRSAALDLFAQSGYAAVSMREIANAVGVQAGALYLYTPDKQTLLFDLMRGHMEQAIASWGEVDVGPDPKTRLEAFVRFHVDHHFDRPNEIFLAYMELRNLTPENFEAIERLRNTYEKHLETILRDGQAQGIFNLHDVRVSTMALIAMMSGVMTWYRDGGRLSRARVQELYWDMAKRMVLA